MVFVLATTESTVRWYSFSLKYPEDILELKPGEFELLEQLDLRKVPGFGNKESAKKAAQALGLKVWRYVKLDGALHTFTLD